MTNYLEHLVGKSIISADPATGEMILSDGSKLFFDTYNSDCCSWIELTDLKTTDAMILSAEEQDTDEGEGGYSAWVHVVTEAGDLNIAEADADASSGYYLHGFALGVKVVK
jgi:hypothetical protein